jgi:hypothetical protein
VGRLVQSVRERDVVPRIGLGPCKKPTGRQRLPDLLKDVSIRFRSVYTAVLTPRIRLAPEYNGSVLIFWRPQDVMELHSKAVQVANV